ncbi:hypothetical protein DFQ28_003752 [Apophysomyces sp. BC1034]|nr:hypothetical protein DFQ28_003752 [Apophysomyces sp. BC1034]
MTFEQNGNEWCITSPCGRQCIFRDTLQCNNSIEVMMPEYFNHRCIEAEKDKDISWDMEGTLMTFRATETMTIQQKQLTYMASTLWAECYGTAFHVIGAKVDLKVDKTPASA